MACDDLSCVAVQWMSTASHWPGAPGVGMPSRMPACWALAPGRDATSLVTLELARRVADPSGTKATTPTDVGDRVGEPEQPDAWSRQVQRTGDPR